MVRRQRVEVGLNLLAELGVAPSSHHERHKTGDEYSQINHGFSSPAFLPFCPSCHLTHLSCLPYSCLKATIGSTRAARWAGTRVATKVTARRIPAADMSVAGSIGFTPNS